jgi:hypothetical protein
VQNPEYFDGVFSYPINSDIRQTAEHQFSGIRFAAGSPLLGKSGKQIYVAMDCEGRSSRSCPAAMCVDVVANCGEIMDGVIGPAKPH